MTPPLFTSPTNMSTVTITSSQRQLYSHQFSTKNTPRSNVTFRQQSASQQSTMQKVTRDSTPCFTMPLDNGHEAYYHCFGDSQHVKQRHHNTPQKKSVLGRPPTHLVCSTWGVDSAEASLRKIKQCYSDTLWSHLNWKKNVESNIE